MTGKKFNFEKVDVKILKMKAGDSFIGTLKQISDRPWVDKKTGEDKVIKQFHFDALNEDGLNQGQIIYFGDGGFQNSMSMAGIKVNDTIMVKKLSKEDLGGGRSVNSYEIFKAN